MSIDERIARLTLDNGKFESGASKSMSTLDKLNEKLKLKGAEEGSSNILKSFKNVDFSAMEKGITALEKRFSTMGIVGMNVVNKISDSLINSAKKVEQATIGQIKSGGWARAMNIANAKFQIEGLGFDWSQIEESVSYGVKDTAYGLDAAASAASQLAASGVDFKKTIEKVNGQDLTAMHKSLRAISGVAAMTNSSYEDIAKIFTTVAGNGRLMGDQLLQLSSRGMNAAAKLAETLHTTEADIRDMVSKGKIDFKTFAFAMDDAFGAHAKEANKTFSGALGNMKAALSRVGEVFASPVINKTNTLFISITGRIDELKNKLKSVKVPRSFDEVADKYKNINASAAGYNEILKSIGDREVKFADDFAEMWETGIEAFSAFVNSVNLGWFDTIVSRVDAVTVKLTGFFNLMKDYYSDSADEISEEINDATKTLKVSADEAKAARDVIAGKFGYGKKQKQALTEQFGEQHAKNIQAYVESVKAAGWSYKKATIKVADANDELNKSEKKVADTQKKTKFKMVMDSASKSMQNLRNVASNLAKSAKQIASAIFSSFAKVFNINTSTVTYGIIKFTGALSRLSEKLVIGSRGSEKVSAAFTAIFTVVKSGLKYLSKAGSIIVTSIKKFKGTEILSTTIRNLWKTAVNLGTAITKVLGAIFKAFGKVFTLNPKAVTSGVNSVTESMVKFSEKLILSDAAAEKVTNAFVEIFKVVKKGIGVLKQAAKFTVNLFKSFKDSSFVDVAKEKVNEFYDNFQKSKIHDVFADNPLTTALQKFFDGITYLLSDNADIPGKITSFINLIVETISKINWSEVLHLAGIAFIFAAIGRFFLSLNKIGKAIDAVAGIPVAINDLLTNFGKAIKNGGKAILRVATAEAIKIIAESIVMIIGAIIAMSMISPDKITQSTAVFLAIGIVFAILLKTIDKITAVGKQSKSLISSLNSIVNGFDFGQTVVNTLKPLIETMRIVGAAAVMMLSLAASVVIISVALAIIEKTGAAKPKNMLVLIGIMTAVYSFLMGVMHAFGKIKGKDLLKYVLLFASLSFFMTTMTGMLIAMSAVMVLVGHLPVAAIIGVGVATSIVIATIITVVKMISKLNPASLAGTAAAMIALGITTSIIMHSFVTVIAAFAGVFVLLAASKFNNIRETLMIMGTIILGIIVFVALIAKMASKIDNLKSVFEKNSTIALISAALATMAYVIKSISESIAIISKEAPSTETLGTVALALIAIVSVLTVAIKSLSDIKPSHLIAVSSGFVAISSTLLMISLAITALSRFGGKNLLKSAIALGIVLAGIGAAIALASASFTKNKNGATNILVGMLSISAVLLVLGHVLNRLNDVDDLTQKAMTIGALMVVLGGVIALMTVAFSKNSNGGADTMLAVGGSFLLVAASMMILATAMKKIAKIGTGLKTAAVVFGIFAGVIVVLAAVATAMPLFAEALMAVGKTFLYVGLGSTLVGVGLLLVAVAIDKLYKPLSKFFDLIEDHKVAALGIAAVLVIITATIMKFVDKLATVLVVIYSIIKDAFSSISDFIKSSSKKTGKWLNKTKTKGKMAIIAMITTLCAAILKTSPTVFNTIGKVILNGLEFLAKIIPEVAEKLVLLLINLLYGLAKAISNNSARLARAIRAIVEALIALVLDVVAELSTMLGGLFRNIPLIGGKLGEFFDALAGTLHDGADSISKDVDRLYNDTDKGVVNIKSSLNILNGSLDTSGKKTSGLTGLMGDYIESLGLATQGVNDLSEAEDERNSKLNTTQSSFQDLYDEATEVERARYDQYAKLDDAVGALQEPYEKAVQYAKSVESEGDRIRTEIAEIQAKYDELVHWDELYDTPYSDKEGQLEADINMRENDLKKAKAKLEDWNQRHVLALSAVEEAKSNLEKAQKAADDYYDANQKILEKLVEARNVQKEIFDIVNHPAISKIPNIENQAYDLLSQAVEQQTGKILDFRNMNHIERELRMKQGNIQDLYNDILAGLIEELAEEDSVEGGATESLNALNALAGNSAESYTKSFTDRLDRSRDRIKKSVEENTVGATNEALEIPEDGGPSGVFEDSGEFSMDGYMSGVENKMPEVSDFMAECAETGVINSFNGRLGVNSPSKVMAESGKFTIMGLIKGMTDTVSELDKAAGGIGTKLIQAFATPLDLISGLMDGTIEYDPTIKPVVDPSNVTKSAASINSAFQTESFDIGKFSGTLAADINTLRRNDESLITELRALREDVNDMTDEIANMQMVLDTGVLVGEISSQVDYSLGTASIRKKRGI